MNLIARRLLIAAVLLPAGAWAQAPETSDTDTETSVELQQMTIFGTAEALQRATGLCRTQTWWLETRRCHQPVVHRRGNLRKKSRV